MKVVLVRGHASLPQRPRQKIDTCVAVFSPQQIIGVKMSGASRQQIGLCLAALRTWTERGKGIIFHSTNKRSHWTKDNISNPNLNNSILLKNANLNNSTGRLVLKKTVFFCVGEYTEYGFDQQRLIWYVCRLWDMVFS